MKRAETRHRNHPREWVRHKQYRGVSAKSIDGLRAVHKDRLFKLTAEWVHTDRYDVDVWVFDGPPK